ncbi:MAG TPA: metal ABC transporter substrate-binding protein [Spirochaetaceae bacterium]|nr:metal ABC transporter substrate-binding protein [Spirochaetaceae bacterium]
MNFRSAFLALAVALLAGLGVQAMGNRDSAPLGKPLVAVSVLPQSYFVRRIAGDKVDVLTIVGPGQSPHAYEPSPRQMADLSKALAWFTVGVEFEHALEPKISSLYPALRLVDTTKGIRYRRLEAHGHDDDEDEGDHEDEHESIDPHVWLGRDSVKVQAAHIRDALSAFDSVNASFYAANYESFAKEIDGLFTELGIKLAALRGKPVFVFHPAFGYFLDEFGIIQEAVETGGKEPTQKALADLIAKAKADGATVIFVQAQFPTGAARSVAKAIGGHVIQIDPLSADWLNNQKDSEILMLKAAR